MFLRDTLLLGRPSLPLYSVLSIESETDPGERSPTAYIRSIHHPSRASHCVTQQRRRSSYRYKYMRTSERTRGRHAGESTRGFCFFKKIRARRTPGAAKKATRIVNQSIIHWPMVRLSFYPRTARPFQSIKTCGTIETSIRSTWQLSEKCLNEFDYSLCTRPAPPRRFTASRRRARGKHALLAFKKTALFH